MAETKTFTPDPTGAGLTRFVDYLISKGYLKTATGSAMKTAIREVLSATEGDDWESIELDTLDFDDTLRRFETLRAMKFTAGSMQAYRSRFLKAVDLFAEFRVSPGTWRPTNIKERSRSKATSTAAKDTPSSRNKPGPSSSPVVDEQAPTSTEHKAAIITYPFPLREGVLASIELPADLTAREARRLSSFIEALAVDHAGGTTTDADE